MASKELGPGTGELIASPAAEARIRTQDLLSKNVERIFGDSRRTPLQKP
jgi:hypothetical protein